MTEDKELKFDKIFQSFVKGDLQNKIDISDKIFETDSNGSYRLVIIEGLRTNINPLFFHLAFSTNYPSRFFTEDQFNQMVLKAAFMGFNINEIKEVEGRKNPNLREMILDYIKERELANRSVDPSLFKFTN